MLIYFGCNTYHVKLYLFQACKVEELGVVDYEEEIKKRTQMVFVPNWFSVDIKTGVSMILWFTCISFHS